MTVLLAGTMAISLMAGCTSTPKQPQESTTPSPYYVVDGKESIVPYVMKIDDKLISIDEYRSFFLPNKMQFEMMTNDPEIWTKEAELEKQLKEVTEEQIKEMYAIENLTAQNKITLTDEDKATLDKQLEEVKSSFESEEEYKTALNESFLTEEIYREALEFDMYVNKLYDLYFGENGTKKISDEDAVAEFNKNYVRVKHVLIEKDEEGKDTNKKLAEEIATKAKAGEDFDTLIKNHNTDPGMEANPDGYYFTYGDMVKPFEDASFALAVDEVSGIVESDFGYHIIKKYALDPAYVEANKATITEDKYAEIFDGEIQKAIEALKVETWEKYDTINVTNVK